MARKRKSPQRQMHRLFLVICEGETEENYVNLLRQMYRLPIKIISKVAGSKINQRLINNYYKELEISKNSIDVFLMYDGDLQEIVENLKKCSGILLISKPCIEMWFLAHYQKPPHIGITSDFCIKRLKSLTGWENYRKAVLTSWQEKELWNKRLEAVKNMREVADNLENYSHNFLFIEILEKFKNA